MPHNVLLDLSPRLSNYLPHSTVAALAAVDCPPRLVQNALNSLRALRHTVASCVPRRVVELIEENDVPPQLPYGEMLDGTVLFADVSGFTAMTEQLSKLGREGAEETTRVMNMYFSTMLDTISQAGGDLLKFAGDAVLVHFPADNRRDDGDRAARTALRMQRAMITFAEFDILSGKGSLSMKIGMAQGKFFAAQVGTGTRSEFVVTGGSIQQAVTAEGYATKGQICLAPGMEVVLEKQFRAQPLADGHHLLIDDLGDNLDSFEMLMPKRRRGVTVGLAGDIESLIPPMKTLLDELDWLAPHLPSVLVQRLISGTESRSMESEHRFATIVFFNLLGVEDILETQGLEAATESLQKAFVAISNAVTNVDGTLTRSDPYNYGSKLLAAFGMPVALSETQLRAVSAATDALRSIQALPLPGKLYLRAGVTHGAVFAGEVGWRARRDYTVMGDTVNVSARLMAKAEKWQVMVSTAVHSRTSALYDYETLEPVMLKGKALPEPVFAVRGLNAQARLDAAGRPLLGRDEELRILHGLLEDTRMGATRSALVYAAAGMGKSHVAADVAEYARRSGFTVLHGRCLPQSSAAPYLSWRTILTAALKIDQYPDQAIQRERLATTLQAIGESDTGAVLTYLLGFEDALSEMAQTAPEFQILVQNTVINVLRRVAMSGPVLILIEDVQWLDNTSAHLLQSVIDTPFPHLTLLTSDISRVEAKVNQRMSLGPLPPQATAALAALVLEVADLDPVLEATVQRLSGGVPLFAQSVAEALKQANVIKVDENGIAYLDGVLPALPEDMQDILLADIDRLPEAERQVLRSAAVIGVHFTTRYLEILLNRNAEEELKGLRERGILDVSTTHGSSDEIEFSFRHSAMQEAVYNSLTYNLRRQMHGVLADGLLKRRDMETPVGVVATHLLQSDQPERGISYAAEAAQHAVERGTLEDALKWYSMAHKSVPDNAEITEQYGTLLWRAGSHQEAVRVYEEISRRRPHVRAQVAILSMDARSLQEVQEVLAPDSPWRRWIDLTRDWMSERRAGIPVHVKNNVDFLNWLGAQIWQPVQG